MALACVGFWREAHVGPEGWEVHVVFAAIDLILTAQASSGRPLIACPLAKALDADSPVQAGSRFNARS